MPTLILTTTATLSLVSALGAQHTTTDTTPHAATVDGVVAPGEYVSGPISGIGQGFGNVVGAGAELFLDSSAAGSLTFGLRKGPGAFSHVAVLYLDTSEGGHTDLSQLSDNSSAARAAISGRGELVGESNLLFAPGFAANVAIAIGWAPVAYADLYALDDTGLLSFVTSGGITSAAGDADAGEREFAFTLEDLGLSPGDQFRYVMTYLDSWDAFRSDEFVGVGSYLGGNPGGGGNAAHLADGDFNTFVTVPEPVSIGLVGAGLAALARRRRSARAR